MIKALKITILVLICVALVSIMISFIQNGFNFTNKSKLILEKDYELGEIKNISVDVKSSDINILKSEDESIHIKVHAQEDKKIDVVEKDDSLNIKDTTKNKVCFGICFGSNKIDIYVPEKYDGSFIIKAKSGDITSTIETFNKYNIKVTSGDINIENIKSLTGYATSGDLKLDKLTSYINFKTTSGDIKIEDLSIDKNSKIKVTSGDVEIEKTNDIYIDTKVTSGDINIKNNNRKADVVLSIKTTSGDIEVN